MEIDKLKVLIEDSLMELYKNEEVLLTYKGNEQSIVFHLGTLLKKNFESISEVQGFKLSVDCEFNKALTDPKSAKLNENVVGIRPDLIVHKRGDNSFNLIAIECKRNKKSFKKDSDKLVALTSLTQQFQYQLGCFINFTNSKPYVSYFVNGVEIESMIEIQV